METKTIGIIGVVVVVVAVLLGITFMGGESELAPEETTSPQEEQQAEESKKGGKIASGWEITTIKEGLPYVVDPLGVAIDAEDNLHLVYPDPDESDITHTYQENGEWKNEVIAELGPGDVGSALPDVVIQEGALHVAFQGAEGLVYAQKENGEWSTEIVDQKGEGSGGLSLGVGDSPHILYRRQGDLLSDNPFHTAYASKVNGEWQTEKLDVPRVASLVVDENNIPHLSYKEEDNIYHGVLEGDQWNFEVVEEGVSDAEAGKVLLSEGAPKFIYSEKVEFKDFLREATLQNDTWQVEEIDTKELSGYGFSSELDKEGQLGTSYGFFKDGIQDDEFGWHELVYAQKKNGQLKQII